MPNLEVKTTAAEQVWAAPDGKMKIYALTLEWQGKPVKAKTYSDAIATPGWSGTVETYEKEGRNGSETFVKQPQRDGGFQRGGGGFKGGGGPKADPFTMYLSYAKDLVVALITQGIMPSEGADGKVFVDLFQNALTNVNHGGQMLYAGRPDAPGNTPVVQETVTTAPMEQVNLDDITAAFGGTPISQEETPWPPKS